MSKEIRFTSLAQQSCVAERDFSTALLAERDSLEGSQGSVRQSDVDVICTLCARQGVSQDIESHGTAISSLTIED